MKGDSEIVTLKRATYRRLHEERRIAEALLANEIEHNKSTQRWGERGYQEQRRIIERLEFVYDVAVRHGATREELSERDSGDGNRNEANE